MSLTYLWLRRTKHPLGSYLWCKTWTKRVLQAPSLVRALARAERLRRCGATVGFLASFSTGRYQGRLKNLHVGNFSFVGMAEIQLHAPVLIGDCVVISDGVKLLTGTHDITSSDFMQINKPIVIERYAWVCTAAIILSGVKVGEGAVIAAGAVVSRDVPDYTVVAGNPAREIKQRCPQSPLVYRPTEFQAYFEAWINKPW